jgi:peptidyl-prolyl cis-trans isomerase SurA
MNNPHPEHHLSSSRIWFLMLCMVLASVTHADSIALDQVVAVVNDGVIFSSQLEERLGTASRQIDSSRNDAPSREALRQQVLDRLILESIQLQLGERAGVTISNGELQNALASVARQNNTDLEGLKARVEADGIPFKSFTKNIEQEIIIEQVQQAAVSKRISVTDQDVFNFLNSEEGKQKAGVTYHLLHILIPIPVDNNGKDADSPDATAQAQQIVRWAREALSQDDFSQLAKKFSKAQDAETGGDLGWRRKEDLPSIYADKVDALATGDVSEPFVAGGSIHILKMLAKKGLDDQWIHQTHARHLLVKTSVIRSEEEARQLLLDLRQQLVNGADFTTVAKKYSEDYATALKGGDLGWISPGQLVSEFQTAMDATAINDISPPFKTQYGWHIVQVLERRTQNMSADMLKQAVRNYLRQKKFEEELPRWLKELRDEAFVDIKQPVNGASGKDTPVTTPDTAIHAPAQP